jgi:hypothetical protein
MGVLSGNATLAMKHWAAAVRGRRQLDLVGWKAYSHDLLHS